MNSNDTPDPIDERAIAAADRLVASFGDLDTEAALRDARDGSGSMVGERDRSGRVRWIAVAAAVALVIGGTVALAANVATRSPNTDAPAPSLTPSSVPDTTVETATPVETTTPNVTDPPATTAPAETPAAVSSVSHLDPPPVLPIRSLGTISVPAVGDGSFEVAIGDLGVAVSHRMYGRGDEPIQIDVVDFDGVARTIPNLAAGALLAYGPGDVAYLSQQGAGLQEFGVVAVPLTGDRVGTAVASTPADINLFLEYPPLSFGHGVDGVVHRRSYLRDQPPVMAYVDVDGQPLSWDGAAPTFALESPNDEGGGLGGVITSSAGTSWTLSVDAAPDRAAPFVGASPPAPGPNGSGIYVTHIGPDANPTVDFGEPTMWVIAALEPDGTATWWSIPDGWQVVASDVWGTVLARQTGTQLELALAEF